MFGYDLAAIMGVTTIIFYILILVFSNLQKVRVFAYLSVIHDVVYGWVIGVMPKVLLNLVVGAVNTYRYMKDYTKVKRAWLILSAGAMGVGLMYFLWFAINNFIDNPSLGLALNWLDFVVILSALWMTNIKRYQQMMLLSAFVGGASYVLLDVTAMVIVNLIKAVIMIYKLYVEKHVDEHFSKAK